MSDLTRWRARARSAIRRYPELLRAEADLHAAKTTPAYTGMPGGSEASRTTELLAIRELSPHDQRDLDAVRLALDTIKRYRNADLRYKLIEICYWRNTHTVDGAAMIIHVSPRTAHEWDRGFIELVDAYRRWR